VGQGKEFLVSWVYNLGFCWIRYWLWGFDNFYIRDNRSSSILFEKQQFW